MISNFWQNLFSVNNPCYKSEIISLLRLSNKKYNQTVIIITHDEKIALEADRVITIDDGKIVKDEMNE